MKPKITEEENFKYKITYDDVLLVPRYSRVLPKSVDLRSKLSKDIILNIPIISAAMDTLTDGNMATAMALEGGLGIIHKNQSIDMQIREIKKVKDYFLNAKKKLEEKVDYSILDNKLIVGAAVGVGENVLWYAQKLLTAGANVLCVDSAHAHSENVIDAVKQITTHYPNVPLIVGNVVTIEATEALIAAGAKIIKVGIGGGSICITRRVCGVGIPQFSAVYEICKHIKKKHKNVRIIADGGITNSGDIVKALGAGADFVMLGNLLAGSEESGGTVVEINKKRYKTYEGMGSKNAMHRGGNTRYFKETQKNKIKYIAEGVSGYVPIVGHLFDIIYEIIGGIKSGFGYCGSLNISELHNNAKFVLISSASRAENHERNIKIEKN